MKQVPPPLESWLTAVGPGRVFEGLVSLLPDAVVYAVNAERDIVAWNDAAERVLGFSRGEVLGRHCLVGVRCPRCLGGCGIATHGRVDDVPIVLHHKDGREIAFRKTAVAFQDAAGAFAGGVEVLVPAGTSVPAAPPERVRHDVVAFHGMVTRDPSMVRVVATIRNIAETEATVLVRGESGTGKELVARAVHRESLRRNGPFVAVNCAAFTASLLESELFGHLKGAFTGATADRPGIFVQADGGTLFLDEVAELPLELQAKLLRVIQERVLVPVGGTRPRTVDVRIVAATHRSLRDEVRSGRFREDLMYRLRVVPLFLPSLRERPLDIELLLWHFIEEATARGPRRVVDVSPAAMRALLDHPWPGNVRELQNVVAYAFAVGRAPTLDVEDLPPDLRVTHARPAPFTSPAPPSAPAWALPPRAVRVDPRAELEEVLARAGGDLGEAARILGVSRTTLWRRRRALGDA